MAAVHHHGMAMLARASGSGSLREPEPDQVVRYTNAAARMFDSFQNGLLALVKFKTGGKQTVVVQHVNVSDGGQAVIAGGDVAAGRGVGQEGEGDRNERATP
jgi:hypothetical protein